MAFELIPATDGSNEGAKECALCRKVAPLRESHVIPAFVFRWLRESSGTGHMRFAENPNRRVQDGLKLPWLCDDCEGCLNKSETTFATRIFYPFIADPALRVVYNDWLLRFCVSLSWRVLKHISETTGLSSFNPQQRNFAEAALSQWADFLLGRVEHPGAFEQHFLPWGPIKSGVSGFPRNFSRYVQRCVEMDVAAVGDKSGLTYTKIGPFMIFGLLGQTENKWKGSKVHVRHGVIQPQQFVLPIELHDYLKFRASNYAAVQDRISEPQQSKIKKEMLGNVERFRSSLTFQAMLQDVRLFGPEAVIRESKGNE